MKLDLFKKYITTGRKRFAALSRSGKIIVVVIAAGVIWFTGTKLFGNKQEKPQYQTAVSERGTLVVSISGSGAVASTNNADVSTEATGVVKSVLVKNGDNVSMGQKIAEIELSQSGKQRMSQALSGYQSATNTLATARANVYSSQSDMLTQWKNFMDVAQSGTYQNPDGSARNDTRVLPEFMTTNDDWLASEAKYKVQTSVVSQAQSAQSAAWLSYQAASPNIYAPITGTISGLSLVPGTVINDQSSSSNTTGGNIRTKVASVRTKATPSITINLTQIDIPKITIGNKATVTFDAFPEKTYTGKVISIDTTGSESNGVIVYPTIIALDTLVPNLYANMTATANILTVTKDNVILVPSGAVTTVNGSASVRILKNGQVEMKPVAVGETNDTQTEITSGLTEGETVITGSTSTVTTNQRTGTSPFSPFGGNAVFRSGGFTTGGRRN